MKLSCAVVACNENPAYLAFWPIVKRAWNEIVGIPVILVYIGHDLPPQLEGDASVVIIPPNPYWPTATQAQCVRLLFPALIQCEGAVIVSDMDMIPLQPQWFHETLAPFADTDFVSYRPPLNDEVVMCYVAACPQTWRDLFGSTSMESIQAILRDWAVAIPSDGRRGGQGWCTDQRMLYQILFQTEGDRVKFVEDPAKHACPRPDRMDRAIPDEWTVFGQDVQAALAAKQFVDFHMPPYIPYKELIDAVCDHAITHRDSPYDPQYHYMRDIEPLSQDESPTTELPPPS